MILRTCSLLIVAMLSIGCAHTGKIKDQAGIGAIAGRNIGRAPTAVLAGPGVGAGIGYLIADETDLAHAEALTEAATTSNFSHSELGPLTNTRWSVRSLTPAGAGDANLGMVVMFRPSGHVVTRTIMPDSTSRLVTERYRVVGDTLIMNDDDFIINAQFRIRGETLTIGAGDFVGVFDRIRSRDGL